MPKDRLVELKNRLDLFPARASERKNLVCEFAELYGVSVNTVYRSIRELFKPKALRRSDTGNPRQMETQKMETYCRTIAALKLRSMNLKGRHLSTKEAIRLLEFGVQTPSGTITLPKGTLTKSTVNHYLKLWGYNVAAFSVEPVVKRFQANHSNECWHFDLSPSDLKILEQWPEWLDRKNSKPVLMLYSIVDDRSGVAFQQYNAVYGEDAESALRFLFSAMSAKAIEGFPFQGIPEMIYMDNGPIAKSSVFQKVMQYLGVRIRCHLPRGKDGRRTTARSKGKVERPFRTTKEVHETLYHFHKPKDLDEANAWLQNHVLRYNEQPHRIESHSRIDDWIKNLPASGIREMCSWDRFCSFAREPQSRKVGPDALIKISGSTYKVDHELADHKVILWWGLFDDELFIEYNEKKYGPYKPTSGIIPLNKFKSYKKTMAEKRIDDVETLSQQITISPEILSQDTRSMQSLLKKLPENTILQKFQDPDPFHEQAYPNAIAAKIAISKQLGKPLSKLTPEQRDLIDKQISKSLDKSQIKQLIDQYFSKTQHLTFIGGEKKANDS
nr:IS481 family transposase [uncultured Desulfobacter sp.]